MFPKLLEEYKTLCVEKDKYVYLYNYIQRKRGESFIIFNNSVTYANKVSQVLKVLGFKGIFI
jgi:superfamily II DNA/RNA helicase